MNGYETAGENLLGRTLLKEQRAGVTHYLSGQLQAKLMRRDELVDDDWETALDAFVEVGYVDTMGHACLLICAHETDGEWFVLAGMRAGQINTSPVPPGQVKLSDKILAALSEARTQGGNP